MTKGRGTPHPKPHGWVVLYVYDWTNSAPETHYMPRVVAVDEAEPYLADVLPTMVVGEKRRLWLSSGNVRDIELADVLASKPLADSLPFPISSDAVAGSSGLPSVLLRAGSGPHPAVTDKVQISATGMRSDRAGHDRFEPPLPGATFVVEDIPSQALVAGVQEMAVGEERWFWVPAARNHGTAIVWTVTLLSIEHRPQVAAPPDLASPGPNAQRKKSGVASMTLSTGPQDGRPDADDEVTVDLTVWASSGRTIETSTGAKWPLHDLAPAVAAEVAEMRIGEKRRIWIPAAAAGYLSENHMSAVADVALIDVHRDIDVPPNAWPNIVTERWLKQFGKKKWPLAKIIDPARGLIVLEYLLDSGSENYQGVTSAKRLCGAELTKALPKLEARVLGELVGSDTIHCEPTACSFKLANEYTTATSLLFRPRPKGGLALEAVMFVDGSGNLSPAPAQARDDFVAANLDRLQKTACSARTHTATP